MKSLIDKNLNYINNYPIFHNHNEIIKNIVDTLNKDRIIIISWMRWLQKTSIIKEFLEKTKIKNYIYINDEIDEENKMKNYWDFFKYLISYEIKHRFCDIIVLQNLNKLENIKNVILELYKTKKYRLMLIWNNIQVEWLKEFEIYNTIVYQNWSFSKNTFSSLLTYWNLPNVRLINNNYFKNIILKWIKNEIILYDIIKPYNIKSVNLYDYTITKIALLESGVSIREISKIIEKDKISINLKTLNDYIDYSINAKIFKKAFAYDLRLEKTITTKMKFYFTDTWIRNLWAWKIFNDFILIENLVFNELNSKYLEVYNWISGTYNFSFYIKDNNYYIQLLETLKESEIKNETSRLKKVAWKWKKFVFIWNLDYLDYEDEVNWVKILWLNKLGEI